VGLGLVFAILMGAQSFEHGISDLESAYQNLDKSLKQVQNVEDENRVAIGCFTKYADSADTITMPTIPGSRPTLLDMPQVKASMDYVKALGRLAKGTEAYVSSEEQYINLKWPRPPWGIQLLPWLNDRYARVRNQINTRIAWAKGEVSDHSCAKR
jgi:hypothetical protein